MRRKISRRDFMKGTAVVVASGILAGQRRRRALQARQRAAHPAQKRPLPLVQKNHLLPVRRRRRLAHGRI